jgi:hypothetical protein
LPTTTPVTSTIKQGSARAHPALAALTYSSSSVAAVLSPSLGRRAPSTSNANTKISLGQHLHPCLLSTFSHSSYLPRFETP